MNLAQISKLILTFLFTSYAALANSAVIYPINNAAILTGAKFDIKIELNNVNSPEEIVVELNGKPISMLVKAKPEFISNEGGKGSSLLYRDIQLSKAGKFQLTAKTPQEKAEVTWDVYSSGPRRVKNVILFVGDGMTIANRTAARVLSKGIIEGKYQGRLAFDDMPSTWLRIRY